MIATKPTVLILGATGRTGSHLVNLLEPESDRPDFADTYDTIPQIIGQSPISFREFVRKNLAEFQ